VLEFAKLLHSCHISWLLICWCYYLLRLASIVVDTVLGLVVSFTISYHQGCLSHFQTVPLYIMLMPIDDPIVVQLCTFEPAMPCHNNL